MSEIVFFYNDMNIDTNSIYSLRHLYKKYMNFSQYIELNQHHAASLFQCIFV